jgi:2-hydroxychromene-2-carboxylate isomerase
VAGSVRDHPGMASAFYFGAMSPYSWFAAERIGALLPDAQWRPVFAGGVFKACGRVSWGLTADREVKLADCEARARAQGLGAIHWPDPWPTNDLLIARAMMFADGRGSLRSFAVTALRMAFGEALDLGEVAAVRAVAERSGLAGDDVVEAISDPQVKAGLRAATDEAVATGVFGVPTVSVGTRLFWGDDRLEEAATAARTPAGTGDSVRTSTPGPAQASTTSD